MNLLVRIFLTIASALIVSCAYPPYDLSFLVVIAWIPFLYAIHKQNATTSLLLGLLHGIVVFAVSTSWLYNLFGTPAMVLWLILASFSGIFARFYSLYSSKSWKFCFVGAALWTGIEFFRAEVFTLYFPWMTPGVGFGPSALSPLIGCYGVSFLIILSGLLVVRWQNSKKVALAGGGLAALLLTIQLWPTPSTAITTPISVMAVQSEMSSENEKVKLSQQAIIEHGVPDIIIWPELAIRGDSKSATAPYTNARKAASHFPTLFVSGTATPQGDRYYNTAVTIDKGKVLGTHYKNHPVPLFSEGIKGTKSKAVKTPLGTIGTPVCYDCDHEDVIRRMVADGANLITVPSLDAIHWGEKQHIQHSKLFHLRAAENRRWIAVAASSGSTQIVDPYGRQVATIPLMQPGVLVGEVEFLEGRTLFNRFGYLIGPACLYFSAGLILFTLFIECFGKRIKLGKKTTAHEPTSATPEE